jgi:hypothetical protein
MLLCVLPGILLAMSLSVVNVFRRTWWPHDTQLGRVEIAGLPAHFSRTLHEAVAENVGETAATWRSPGTAP